MSAKSKKPTLYATVLMTRVFTDKEMREGAVEPKETNLKKKAPDQNKINIVKLNNNNCSILEFNYTLVLCSTFGTLYLYHVSVIGCSIF